MKKLLIGFLSIIFISVTNINGASAQLNNDVYHSSLGINKSVKNITIKIYKAKVDNGKVINDGDFILKEELNFNEKGSLICDKLDKTSLDNLKNNNDPFILMTQIYEIVDNENFIVQNNKLQTVFYNEKDSVILKKDNKGRYIKESVFFPNGILKSSVTFSYNIRGLLTTSIQRDCQSDEILTTSYTYDNYDRLAHKIMNFKDKGFWQEKFIYDKFNNWIVKVNFDNQNPLYYIEREIEYID